MSDTNRPDPAPITTDDDGEKLKKQEFEDKLVAEREAQNLPEGAMPEQRPQAFLQPDNPHSRVYEDLVEAGDPRAGTSGDPNVGPQHDKSNFDRAASAAQAKEAAKQEHTAERLYPGARAWIDNPGTPDHGRAVAVNAVHSFEDVANELLAQSGGPNARFAKVADYECRTRDGRSELMIVSAEHLRRAPVEAEWGKTPLFAKPVEA